jgi:sugar O-acyltransferase (sialic acid O-acetyltransferase NeuD family)
VKLALIGYGELGRYMQDMVSEAYPVVASETVFFDDQLAKAGADRARPFADHASDDFADYSFFVCLGYKHLRLKKQIIDRLVSLARSVPHYVHPSSYVHPSVTIGHGSMIYPGCSIDRNTKIGRGVWIANADVIAHDCAIGDTCWFGASVTLSGHVTVGESTFIGSGTTISNDVAIGSSSTIGLSTAVTKNIGDGISAIGNPMKILDRPLKLI